MAPKFEQRHHNAIADVFWIRREELKSLPASEGFKRAHLREWIVLQARFRNMLAGDNARFKPTKFDIACGLTGRVIVLEELEPPPDPS